MVSVKYNYKKKFTPQKLAVNNIDRLSTSLVPKHSKILELGCATGHMTKFFKQKLNCQVVSVDLEPKAKPKITGNLDNQATWVKIKKHQPFNIVFASAIIEHLIQPETTLQLIKQALKPQGILIITTSNVAHWRNRLNHLLGKWDYQDYGVLDRTHLKFYTYNSFRTLIKQAGFKILSIQIDPAGGIKYFNWLFKYLPNLYAHQVVIQAQKA